MSRIKKIIFLLLFPLIANLVVACCDCMEPLIEHYTNRTLTIHNLDNAGNEPAESTSVSIKKAAYGIRIKLFREKTACIEPTKLLFIQSAYAMKKCNCPEPNQFFAKDSITGIKIITLNDFDNGHLANTDISAYFKVYSSHTFSTIENYIKRSIVLFDESEFETSLDLLLMTSPVLNSQHQFKIQVSLSDGRVIEEKTSIELI